MNESGSARPVPEGTAVIIAVGGNLGESRAIQRRFERALTRLGTTLPGHSARLSPLYHSAPVGPIADQPPFLNGAIELVLGAALAPLAILDRILAIEGELGRVRDPTRPKGPRTIDLDLLFAGDQRVALPRLHLPHPRIAERLFVLRPLADLRGGDWLMPGIGRTVAQCMAAPQLAGQRAELRSYSPRPGSAERYSPGA
ncbi:MAG: 2-amino-4-hydroxy-6-hydroxymethyldihydropteridine diphosphokinase [Myxococcota bacterium]